MKKTIIFFLLLSSFAGFSQEDAWVYLKDKPNSSSFLANPLTMLSQRAIDRRTAQGIAIDISDVPIDGSYLQQISTQPGILVKSTSKWMNCIHVRATLTSIQALNLLPFVKSIVFAKKSLNPGGNKVSAARKNFIVNNKNSSKLDFNYGTSSNQIKMLAGDLLHKAGYTGQGKIIAVLDSGFPSVNVGEAFQRLISNNQILGGYNFVNKNANFYSSNSHGTTVLSLIGGYIEGKLIGTAPDAQFYLYITEDVATENPVEESYWVEAAEEADRIGADIITSSLGYFGYDNKFYSHQYSDMTGDKAFASRGANIAFSKGIVVLASAGNSGEESEPYVGVPAEAKNVIAVGAVKADRTYASFSSIGPSYDGRVKPDVMAQGEAPYLIFGGIVTTNNGTSFSCPILAGMVACLWQAMPDKTAVEIKNIILQSSDNFAEPPSKSRTFFGYGIPDFSLALNGLSYNNSEKTADIEIHPNPTTGIIYIGQPKNSGIKSISIYNLLGQKLIEESLLPSTASIMLNNLHNGTYFYKLDCNGFFKTGKIIKK